MGKILDAFFNDQLRVNDVTGKRTPEHQALCDRDCKLGEKLEEKLNDEEKELLNRLVDTLFAEGTCYAQNSYVCGYQLGVLMTMEVFEAGDAFWGEVKTK